MKKTLQYIHLLNFRNIKGHRYRESLKIDFNSKILFH